LLTESVESFKKEKKDLQTKLSKLENDQKNYKREKENLIKKNKDKMIDIQCLNEQNEKLNELIKKLKEEKAIFDTKIVTLENDIDHCQNKIREYEDFIDELKVQLEDALEENITLQTEFETFKLNAGDQLIRKEEELRDIRNDITNKEKLIQRLSKPTERFNIQKMQQKLIKDKKYMNYQRRYTIAEKQGDLQIQDLDKKTFLREELEKINRTKRNTKEIITTNNDLNVIVEDTPSKKEKELVSYKTSQKFDDLTRNNNNNNNSNANFNSNNSNNSIINNKNTTTSLFGKAQKNASKVFNFTSDNEKEKEKGEDNKSKVDGINDILKKQFGDLVICEENKIYLNPLVHKMFNKEQVKEITIALQNLLIRIKQRKNHLANCKKDLIQKLSLRFK
jgi:hypothetical protein